MRSVYFGISYSGIQLQKLLKNHPRTCKTQVHIPVQLRTHGMTVASLAAGRLVQPCLTKVLKTDILAAARRSDAAGPGDIHHSQQIVQGSLRTFQQTEMLKNKQENQTKKPKSMVVFWDQSVLVRDTCDILGDGLLQTILLNGNYLHLEITLSLMKTTTLFPCRKKVSVSLCMHAETNNVLHRPTGIFVLNVNRV